MILFRMPLFTFPCLFFTSAITHGHPLGFTTGADVIHVDYCSHYLTSLRELKKFLIPLFNVFLKYPLVFGPAAATGV